MKDSILFLPAAPKSHVDPAIYLAHLLRAEYDSYIAVTDAESEKRVSEAGFHALRTGNWRVAAGMEEQYVFEKYKKTDKWEILKAVHNDELYQLRQQELYTIVDQVAPQAIFIDVLNSTDLLVLSPRYKDIRFIYLNPMLSTYRVNGFPALHEGEWLKAHQRRSEGQKGIPVSRFFSDPLGTMIEKSKARQLDRLMEADAFRARHPVAPDATQVMLFENIPEIVMAPLELEVSPGVRKPNQHYLGLCISGEEAGTDHSQALEKQFTKILKNLWMKGPLIYYCLGSYEGPDEALLDFLDRLLDAVRSIGTANAILSLNERVTRLLHSHRWIPDNVFLFNELPQSLLMQADLFVTHGNLAALKGGIFYEVPMLVYPHGTPSDQAGNALKVEYFGLGLRGNFETESAFDVREKILELLSGEKYLRAISLFRKRVTDIYREEKVLNVLHRLLKNAVEFR